MNTSTQAVRLLRFKFGRSVWISGAGFHRSTLEPFQSLELVRIFSPSAGGFYALRDKDFHALRAGNFCALALSIWGNSRRWGYHIKYG